MSSLEEIRNVRIKKLEALVASGHNPYPIDAKQDATIAEVIFGFSKFSKKKSLFLVGRVMALRPQGALIFLNFTDGTGLFQALLKKETLGDSAFAIFSDTVDIGDFVELLGKLFVTKRNEKTIEVSNWRILAKSLRPLPEKWHGLQDIDERFRRRYLDALMDPTVKERFITRSKIITEMRKFLDKAGYLEVETPALQPLYGGATALPFATHHKALDLELYLRISDELYLKRMLIAGFPKVYEIARDFRNEGIDMTHNPEFTMVEFYEAFATATSQRAFVEKMMKALTKSVYGKMSFDYNGAIIDFSKKFAVVSYYDLIRRYVLISNPETISLPELKVKALQVGIDATPGDTKQKILDSIYKKMCRPKLIQPTFIVDYPVEYLPLAKRKDDNKDFVDAFQFVAGGIELAKAFSELNDPIDQASRFEAEEKNKKDGEADAQRKDDDFIEAMEYGMPPSGGVGIGIDRLVMFLTNTKNIKEVIFFPTMRPKSAKADS